MKTRLTCLLFLLSAVARAAQSEESSTAAVPPSPTATSTISTPFSTSAGLKCPSEDFHCLADSLCIPSNWRCDGINDCGDNSDEARCEDGEALPSRAEYLGAVVSCSPDQFKCQDYNRSAAKCIARGRLCDDTRDCGDGSDEGGLCGECRHFGCQRDCLDHPYLGPACVCLGGELLNSDAKTCRDVPECQLSHNCNQVCVEEHPGFHCACVEGFELEEDGRGCRLVEEGASLFFARNHEVLELHGLSDLAPGQQPDAVRDFATSRSGHVLSLDYDPNSDSLWLGSVTNNRGAVSRVSRESAQEQDVLANVWGLGNLAVDWVANNIYLTTSNFATSGDISFCSQDGRYCTSLNLSPAQPAMQKPRGLALHPRRGVVFWSDWGENGHRIEAAAMDGSQRIPDLVLNKVAWPNSLAVDYASERLFWADASFHLIELLDPVSGHRNVSVGAGEGVHHPYSIAVFNDRVYWSDWVGNSVFAAAIDNRGRHDGSPTWSLLPPREEYTFYSLAVQATALHNMDLYNPCQFANCSHLCAVVPSSPLRGLAPGQLSYGAVQTSCLCPYGYEADPLDQDHCLPLQDDSEAAALVNWEVLPRMAPSLMKKLCAEGTACVNGGECLPDWKRWSGSGVAAVCECPAGYGGRFCEVDGHARAQRHGLPSPTGAGLAWVGVLMLVGLVLVVLAVLTGYYSRKWTPVKKRSEALLPRIPSVSFFRGSRSAAQLTATPEEREQIVRMEDGQPSLDLDRMDSFANPLYTGPDRPRYSLTPVSSAPDLRPKGPASRSIGSGDDSGVDTNLAESGEHNPFLA